MSDANQPQTSTEELRKVTGRDQLVRALEAGAGAFRQQLRLLLAICQNNGLKSSRLAQAEKPLTIRQARLYTLVQLAGSLPPAELLAVYKDVVQIGDASVRLPLLAKLALHLPPAEFRLVVRDIWNQTRTIVDPVVRAHILFELAPLLLLVNDEPATPSILLQLVSQAGAMKNTEARLRCLTALVPRLPQEVALRTFRRVLSDLAESHNDGLCARSLVALSPYVPPELAEATLEIAGRIRQPVERARVLTALARHMETGVQPRLREQALEAILEIDGEEERAEALIAFAPNLEAAAPNTEYPAILEKALAVVVMITRRPVRAKVLVGLAPHLTPDLQGEALAAVHSLPGERERATLLAELAPQLPGNMLVASLAVAHTMREQDSRVHALSILAHYVPESARQQTMLDALAAASNLASQYERVRALVSLMDILPPHLIEQALTNALETTRLIDNENTRSRSLSLLGPHLSPRLRARALEIAADIHNPQQRLNALIGMMNGLNDDEHRQLIQQLLVCARQMPLEYKRARALVSIAPHMKPESLAEVNDLADKLDDPIDRVNVYIAVAQNLPPDQRPALIARAWATSQRIEEGYDRASVIAAIAPFLPASAAGDLTAAILKTINDVADDYDKASTMTLLAPLLGQDDSAAAPALPGGMVALLRGMEAALSTPQQTLRASLLRQGVAAWQTVDPEQAYTLWKHLARRLVGLPLPDVLLAVEALLPVIREFAGEEGLREVAATLGAGRDGG
ncbi:MAG: hypothetical protein MUE40_11115 [Anaerolineae bacterium]|nr:hypothetical protein [Anaerolineae bacterium]